MSEHDQEMLRRVQQIIAHSLRIPAERIRPDSLLRADLGAESLDFVDMEFSLETEFGIEFYHESVMTKLGDLFAPEVLEENGRLTAFGAEVLRDRMPEVPRERLQPGMPAGIGLVLTPLTWIRAIQEIVDARPEHCPRCRSGRLLVRGPSLLGCQDCGAEIQAPKGEACIEAWVEEYRARRSAGVSLGAAG